MVFVSERAPKTNRVGSRRSLGRIDGTLCGEPIRAVRPVLICVSFILTSSVNLACREPLNHERLKNVRERRRPQANQRTRRDCLHPRMQTLATLEARRQGRGAGRWVPKGGCINLEMQINDARLEDAKEARWPPTMPARPENLPPGCQYGRRRGG